MAKVGAQRAAELTGRSKSTIQRAMKTGKLSYEVDANERRVIDVSELERAFGLLPPETVVAETSAVEVELEKATQMLEAERLKMRIRMLEDQLDMAKNQIEDIKGQRDQWQKQAQQVLLTSQYSQKQAEELKAELKERDRAARARRQQEMERRSGTGQSRQGSDVRKPVRTVEAVRQQMAAKAFDIQSLWHKIRGEKQAPPAPKKQAAG